MVVAGVVGCDCVVVVAIVVVVGVVGCGCVVVVVVGALGCDCGRC